MQRIGLLFLFALSTVMGCRSLDDDSEYAIRTHAAFFFCPDSNGNGAQVVRFSSDALTPNWNASVGISQNDLSDALIRDNMVWLSSGNQKLVLQIDPTDGSVQERFDNLPIAPHILAVGREQLLIADTSARKIAFVRLRNGETVQPSYTGDPRMCLYNNARFYLVQDSDAVVIYDEKGLAPRGTAHTGTYVDDLMFDSYYNVRVISHDSAGSYAAIIGGNADYLAQPNYLVDFEKVRYSAYFYPRFGTELTKDLQLRGFRLETTLQAPLLDSIDNFEADFFSGMVYCTWQDSLLLYSAAQDSVLRRIPFPYTIQKSFYQYGGGE